MLNILIQDAQSWLASPIDERLLALLKRAQHQEHAMPCHPYLANTILPLSDEQLNSFPFAAVHQLGEGDVLAEDLSSKSPRLFFMTPVHFVLQRDHFTLGPLSWAQLSQSESQDLFETIRDHLSPEGFTLTQGCSGQWILEAPVSLDIKTTLPHMAVFQDTSLFQPHGKQEREWRTKLNEIQMLLFEHPVNLAREKMHRPLVNSVWIWGNGVANPSWTQVSTGSLQEHAFLNGLLKLTNDDANRDWKVFDAKALERDSQLLLAIIQQAKHQVNLHIDLGQRMLFTKIRPADPIKFWRKLPAVFHDSGTSHD